MIATRNKMWKTSDVGCNCKHNEKGIAEVASTFALIQPSF